MTETLAHVDRQGEKEYSVRSGKDSDCSEVVNEHGNDSAKQNNYVPVKSQGESSVQNLLTQCAVVHVTVCEFPKESGSCFGHLQGIIVQQFSSILFINFSGNVIPKIRTSTEKERFYTGCNRFDLEPDEMYRMFRRAVEKVPTKPPTNHVEIELQETILRYERGFTANPNHPNVDIEKFSWILGAKFQPCMDLHDRLRAMNSDYFDYGNYSYCLIR